MNEVIPAQTEQQELGGVVTRKLAELNLTENDVFDWMAHEDMSHRKIARKLGCSAGSVWNWLQANAGRSARARACQLLAAEACLDKQEEAIEACADDAPPAAVAKMREKVQYWARRAAIRNPAYSDRPQVVVNVGDNVRGKDMSRAELEQIAAQDGIVIEGTATVIRDADGPLTDGSAGSRDGS